MKGLTKRQQEVLTFVKDYIAQYRYSPSYREIMDHFDFSTPSSAAKHVHSLIKKGFLTNEKQTGRSLYPVKKDSSGTSLSEIELPYIGFISEDCFIETFAQTQTLVVPSFLVCNPNDTYILRARGEALEKERIADGDLLIVEARSDAYDGEVVIATVEEKKILIKKYHPEGNTVRLLSQCNLLPASVVHQNELSIHGVLISLLRLYSY